MGCTRDVSAVPHTNSDVRRRITAGGIVAGLAILVAASLPWDGGEVRESACWVLPNGHTVQIPGNGECPLGAEDRMTAAFIEGKRVALHGTETLDRALRGAGTSLDVEVLTPNGRELRKLPVFALAPNERLERSLIAGAVAGLVLVLPLSILWRSGAHAALPFAIAYGLLAAICVTGLAGRNSTLLGSAALFAFCAIPAVVLQLAFVFPRDRRIVQAAPRSQWLPYLMLFLLVPAGWFALVRNPGVWPAFLFTVLALTAGAWMVFISSCIFALRESDSAVERARARLLCYGAIFLPLLPTIVLARNASGIPEVLAAYTASTAVMLPLPIGLAITRYNLFNVGWDARRSIGRIVYLMSAAGLVTLVFHTGSHLVGDPQLSVLRTFVLSLIALSIAETLLRRVPGFIDSMVLPKLHVFRKEQRMFANRVATLTDEDEVARLLAESIMRTVEPEGGCVFLNLDGIWRPVCPFGIRPVSDASTARSIRVLLGGDTLVHFAREQTGDVDERHQLLERGIEVGAALRSGGRLLGLVLISSRRDRRPYSDVELELLESLVTQTTTTLEGARLAGELVTAERHSTTGRVALALAHDLGKELDWIARLAKRMPERLEDENRLRRDAGQIAEMASGVQEALQDFVEESARSSAEADATRLDDVFALATRRVTRVHGEGRVTIRLDPSLRSLMVHPATIRVAANLLDNALRASKPGQPVEFSALRQGDAIAMTISDTGCGMTPEVAERAFTAGFTTRRDGGGLGVGLSAAREIIEALGGNIEIDTEIERGTKITIVLRLEENETS